MKIIRGNIEINIEIINHTAKNSMIIDIDIGSKDIGSKDINL